MEKAINKYFDSLQGGILYDKNDEIVIDKKGNPVITPDKPPTTAGLCRALGFNSRQTLLNYRKDGKFKDILDDAMLRIEEYTEMRLFDRDGINGAKFSLANNFKWKTEKIIGNEYSQKDESGNSKMNSGVSTSGVIEFGTDDEKKVCEFIEAVSKYNNITESETGKKTQAGFVLLPKVEAEK